MRKTSALTKAASKGQSAAAGTNYRGYDSNRTNKFGQRTPSGSHYEDSSVAQSRINEEEEESKHISSHISDQHKE